MENSIILSLDTCVTDLVGQTRANQCILDWSIFIFKKEGYLISSNVQWFSKCIFTFQIYTNPICFFSIVCL